ncbi:MAG: hypothetical protein O3B09_02440 [Proteobacteria bacterium]|nr:hypothetical protein [Pseudomonadota bacterium]
MKTSNCSKIYYAISNVEIALGSASTSSIRKRFNIEFASIRLTAPKTTKEQKVAI